MDGWFTIARCLGQNTGALASSSALVRTRRKGTLDSNSLSSPPSLWPPSHLPRILTLFRHDYVCVSFYNFYRPANDFYRMTDDPASRRGRYRCKCNNDIQPVLLLLLE